MTGLRTRNEIEERLNEVRRLIIERQAGIEPNARFADRVIARLPRNEAWSFDWAVRRVLPASIALAVALMIAVVATGRTASREIVASYGDPLEWLLDGRQELR